MQGLHNSKKRMNTAYETKEKQDDTRQANKS